MADRLTPPMRYPRYGEESSDNHSSGKKEKKAEIQEKFFINRSFRNLFC